MGCEHTKIYTQNRKWEDVNHELSNNYEIFKHDIKITASPQKVLFMYRYLFSIDNNFYFNMINKENIFISYFNLICSIYKLNNIPGIDNHFYYKMFKINNFKDLKNKLKLFLNLYLLTYIGHDKRLYVDFLQQKYKSNYFCKFEEKYKFKQLFVEIKLSLEFRKIEQIHIDEYMKKKLSRLYNEEKRFDKKHII